MPKKYGFFARVFPYFFNRAQNAQTPINAGTRDEKTAFFFRKINYIYLYLENLPTHSQ